MDDEFDNPWKELAEEGLTRPDQIEDYKDWLAIRLTALDRLKKRFDDLYATRSANYNHLVLGQITLAQFRYDLDKWELDQYITGLEDDSQ